MNSYDQSLMEKSLAEGWIDGCYKSAEIVQAICEEKGLNFDRVKKYRQAELDQ
jgi:hypothetical protein